MASPMSSLVYSSSSTFGASCAYRRLEASLGFDVICDPGRVRERKRKQPSARSELWEIADMQTMVGESTPQGDCQLTPRLNIIWHGKLGP